MANYNKKNCHKNIDISTYDASWLDEELNTSEFPDQRLQTRCLKIAKKLWAGVGNPIPLACEDWANTKAAYRFFSNARMTEKEILQGHFQSTQDRFSQTDTFALILHDTTEFSYKRAAPEKIGLTKSIRNGNDIFGRPTHYTKCGILLHSSLVVTPEGLLPLNFGREKNLKGRMRSRSMLIQHAYL